MVSLFKITKQYKQFIALNSLMLLIMLNSYLLTALKDSLIIVFYGVDTLSFIKTYIMLPTSFLFWLFYMKIVNVFNARTIFHGTVVCFITLFILLVFGAFSELSDLSSKRIIAVMFYMMAELWTIIMVGVLFWQFANSIYSEQNAKQQYWCFQLSGNLGVIIAGQFVHHLNKIVNTNWLYVLRYSIIFFSILALFTIILYEITYKYIGAIKKQELRSELKIPFKESLKLLANSPIITGLLVLIVSYGCVEILTEISWKYYVQLLCPTAHAYSSFMGTYTTLLGISTIMMNLFNGIILKKFDFQKNAWYLPKTVLFCSMITFALIIVYSYQNSLGILTTIVWFGLFQNILFKGVKYSFFDPTKERIYISLSPEHRTKGKALVDALGNRLGKATGGIVQSIVFYFCGLNNISIILLFLFVALFLKYWLCATKKILKNCNEQNL